MGKLGLDPWVRKTLWRRKWQPTPVLLPGKSHGRRSLVDYSLWGHKESDTTERLHFFRSFFLYCHTEELSYCSTEEQNRAKDKNYSGRMCLNRIHSLFQQIVTTESSLHMKHYFGPVEYAKKNQLKSLFSSTLQRIMVTECRKINITVQLWNGLSHGARNNWSQEIQVKTACLNPVYYRKESCIG